MRNKTEPNAPDGKATEISVETNLHILDDSDLMHVEEKSWKITNQKHCNDEHENHREAVISTSSSLSSPPDGKIYLQVEEEDRRKWKQTKNQKPCPVDVPGHINVIDSKFCDIKIDLGGVSVLVVDDFALKEFWNVEDEREYDERANECKQMVGAGSCVLLSAVVGERIVNCSVSLHGNEHCDVDGAHH